MRGMRQILREYKVGMRWLQGVQGGYEAPKRGIRQVQGRYRGTRQLLGGYKGYEVAIRDMMYV